MKKITALALIAISLAACKKETTKTVTKVNPETGKTETVTVTVPEEEKVSTKMAIVDSSGIYKQTFLLEKGKTYPLTSYQRDIQSISTPEGKTMSGTNEITDEMSITVNDFKDNVYDLSINLIGKRNSNSANGKTVISDTKGAQPKEEQLKGMYIINKAMVGNKLNMKMTVNGKINSITGFDTVYKKIDAALVSLVKEPKQKAQVMEGMKASFNEKMLKEQFQKNLTFIPTKGVKIGEKWTDTEDILPGGDIKLTTNYSLVKVADGKAEIAVTGTIPTKTNKRSQEGMTHSMSVGGTQTGKIILDAATGMLLHENVSIKTDQKETLSDGKKSQSITQTSNSSIIINPAYK